MTHPVLPASTPNSCRRMNRSSGFGPSAISLGATAGMGVSRGPSSLISAGNMGRPGGRLRLSLHSRQPCMRCYANGRNRIGNRMTFWTSNLFCREAISDLFKNSQKSVDFEIPEHQPADRQGSGHCQTDNYHNQYRFHSSSPLVDNRITHNGN
jgi:hypothetical protein